MVAMDPFLAANFEGFSSGVSRIVFLSFGEWRRYDFICLSVAKPFESLEEA